MAGVSSHPVPLLRGMAYSYLGLHKSWERPQYEARVIDPFLRTASDALGVFRQIAFPEGSRLYPLMTTPERVAMALHVASINDRITWERIVAESPHKGPLLERMAEAATVLDALLRGARELFAFAVEEDGEWVPATSTLNENPLFQPTLGEDVVGEAPLVRRLLLRLVEGLATLDLSEVRGGDREWAHHTATLYEDDQRTIPIPSHFDDDVRTWARGEEIGYRLRRQLKATFLSEGRWLRLLSISDRETLRGWVTDQRITITAGDRQRIFESDRIGWAEESALSILAVSLATTYPRYFQG